MAILNCLSKINFFKVPVRLKVNKSNFYSSGPGEILSLFIIGVLMYMLTTHDLFYKRNPETFEKSLASEKFYTFNMTLENFFIAVKLAGFGGIGIDYDPSIYSFQVTYVTSMVNASGLTVQDSSVIDMIPCINSSYYQKFKYLIDIHPTTMCLPKSEFQLIGSYTEKKISKFFISLRKCQNSTLNNNFCKTFEEIEKVLNGKYFAYTYFDNQIDLANYLSPIQTKTPAFYKAIEPKIRKKIYYKTDNALIQSDVGFLMENIKEDKTWIFEQDFEDFDFANNLGLMELHFLSNNIERTFIRRYKKVQEAMADLGGILNFLVMSCYVLLKLIPFTGVDYLLSKKLFSYKKSKKKKDKNWKEIKKRDMTTTIITEAAKSNFFIPSTSFSNIKYPSMPNCISNPESPINNNGPKLNENEITKIPLDCLLRPQNVKISFHSGDADLNSDLPDDQQILGNFQKKLETMRTEKKIKNIKNMKKGRILASFIKKKNKINSIDISLKEFMTKQSWNNLSEKLKLLSIARNKIRDRLDIKNILEKLQEIDKIKYLLLNPQQLLLFQLISKPEILTEEEEDHECNHTAEYLIADIMKKYEEASDEKIEKLVIYYNEIKNKPGKENLDSRLLNLLDDDLKNFLECGYQ